MKKRTLHSLDYAVVGIVVAVLLIGLVVSVVALIQTLYIPKWMEEKEAEHMEEVIDQFTRLKFAMDTQIASNQIGIPIATTITLGSKELPFLLSQRSYGQLEILSYPYSGCIFEINTNMKDYNPILIGTIKYSSTNAYYIHQEFIYESGAIITNQTDGYDMTIKPSISFNDETNILKINLVDISPVGGKSNGGGYGSTAIMTEFSGASTNNTNPPVDENVMEISITSNYPNEWYEFMNVSLNKTLNPKIEIFGKKITITFTTYKPKLELKVNEIYAQIGPGWVE